MNSSSRKAIIDLCDKLETLMRILANEKEIGERRPYSDIISACQDVAYELVHDETITEVR